MRPSFLLFVLLFNFIYKFYISIYEVFYIQFYVQALSERAKQLEEENKMRESKLSESEKQLMEISENAKKAEVLAKDLVAQLDKTSQDYEEALKQIEIEKAERIRTEKKLKMAENALYRLDKALRDSGVKIDVGIEVGGVIR